MAQVIDQAVTDGVITQGQADALEEAKENRGFMPGRGGRGGVGGFERGGENFQRGNDGTGPRFSIPGTQA